MYSDRAYYAREKYIQCSETGDPPILVHSPTFLASSKVWRPREIRPLGQRLEGVAVDLVELRVPGDVHHDVKLGQEGLDLVADALLAAGAQGPDPQPADEDELGAERERLEHVSRAADARVEHDLG